MTDIQFGDQHDESKAEYDFTVRGSSNTKIGVGEQFDRSTRKARVRDYSSGPADCHAQSLDGNAREHQTQRISMYLAFGFGLLLIACVLSLALFLRNPTRLQAQVIAVLLALASGGLSSILSGILNVRLKLAGRMVIGATGALAVFVIVYFFVPAMAR